MANKDWRTVSMDELEPETLALYERSKAAYRAYKAAKDAFEQAMQADNADSLPEGMELKFGYMFGKLSVAIGQARERKQAKAQVERKTLAQWLEEQRQ